MSVGNLNDWRTRARSFEQLAAYVFDTTTRDPLTMAIVVAMLVATALVATLIPAHRATRMNLARTRTSV